MEEKVVLAAVIRALCAKYQIDQVEISLITAQVIQGQNRSPQTVRP